MSQALRRYKKPDSSEYQSADSQLYYSAEHNTEPTAPTERQVVDYDNRLDVQLGRLLGKAARRYVDKKVVKPASVLLEPKTKKKPHKSAVVPLPIPLPSEFLYQKSGKPVPSNQPVEKTNVPGVYQTQIPGKTSVYSVVKNPEKSVGVYVMSQQGKNALRTNLQRGGRLGTVKSAPTAYSRRISLTSKPKFMSGSKGIVIQHRELITQLISSSVANAFSATDLTINPGKSGTFPWLSTLAGNFDQYVFRSLKFHLVSNQPTTVGGRIGLGYDYDSTDPAPADRNEFFSMTHHAECAPWDSVMLQIPVDGKMRFVNSHTTTDSKLIDCGQITLMSDTITATSTALADVIVDYVVELVDAQQAVFSSMSAFSSAITAFSSLRVVGPVVAQLIATSSTTVLEASLPQGYYLVGSHAHDTGAGTPVIAPAVHGGVGFGTAVGSTTDHNMHSIIKITTNDGAFRFTFSGVTIANLETITLMFTRVSATYYNSLTSNFEGALAVY